nr:uncharacterized protein LOC113743944 [Coffea arabica]
MVGEGAQHASFLVYHNCLPIPVTISIVHAWCTREERRALWSGLLRDKPLHGPWLVGGDFNVVVETGEKKGGLPFPCSLSLDFLDFMSSAELFDAGFSGSSFTWCNNRLGRARIWKRLDWLLLNASCYDVGLAVSVSHLARDPSDHSPLLLSVKTREEGKPLPFRFINAWTTYAGFRDVVQSSWQQGCSGSPFQIVCSKLTRLKADIKGWNKRCFGNIFANSRRAEEAVLEAEKRVEEEGSSDAQESLQRANVEWRRCLLDDQGYWIDSEEGIGAEAVRYFSSLFSAEPTSSWDLSPIIPRLIQESDNELLERVPSMEEVRRVIFAMDGDSAAGPDGYTGKFFTFAWDIIAQDIYNAVVSFFCGEEVPRRVTATFILLIPKVQNPASFAQFRPISLCNFLNKVLFRILAERLAPLLPRIISLNQSRFVRGRQISDNYLLTQEVISGIGRKNRGGNVALKLDMTKAYDRVSWVFLVNVLRTFGFGERWIDMVWRLISNPWFSVLLNGTPHGFFPASRGLRQGDPLSPSLFILAAEVLSRMLNQLLHRPGFCGFKVPRACPSITHLGFADDILIFSSASTCSLKMLMETLARYEGVSGQSINSAKSGFMVHVTLPRGKRALIQRITGFSQKEFPVRYLGCPLFVGRQKKEFFQDLSNAVYSKISSWKNRLLSPGGKVVLIKHVLSSIPLHLLAMAHPPKSTLGSLERLFANFLWRAVEGIDRHHWIRWRDLCAAKEEGGVGFRSLSDVARAFSVKLWWRFRQQSSLWAIFMMAKYVTHAHPGMVGGSVGASVTWCRMLQVRELAERHITFVIRSGNSHFWFDNWLGSGSLSSRLGSVSDHRIADFLLDGRWNYQLLAEWMPADIVAEIIRFTLPRIEEGEEDVMVWAPSQSGVFTVRTAFELVRCHGPRSFIFSRNIWKARNKARFEGVVYSPHAIRGFIFDDIRNLFSLKYPGSSWALPTWQLFYESLGSRRGHVSFRLVKWLRPAMGELKLNTDGCSRGNPGRAGGGGVLRDGEGKFLFAFSTFTGSCSSIQAEARALLFGVQLCIARGHVRVHMEVDSLVLAHIVQRVARCPWSIDMEVRSLLQLLPHVVSITHYFREANQVADILSNVGCDDGYDRTYYHLSELPSHARGAFRLDRLGLPSLRKC